MAFGGASSRSDPTNEWWGPDLTPPTAGDKEHGPGRQTFPVSKDTWDRFMGKQKLRCTPDDMPHGYYKIVEREIVADFMTDTKEYYMTVEWDDL